MFETCSRIHSPLWRLYPFVALSDSIIPGYSYSEPKPSLFKYVRFHANEPRSFSPFPSINPARSNSNINQAFLSSGLNLGNISTNKWIQYWKRQRTPWEEASSPGCDRLGGLSLERYCSNLSTAEVGLRLWKFNPTACIFKSIDCNLLSYQILSARSSTRSCQWPFALLAYSASSRM